jgi:hypothetical protein
MLLEVCLERRGMERFQLQLIIILVAAIAMAWSNRPPSAVIEGCVQRTCLADYRSGSDPRLISEMSPYMRSEKW